ncbi:MAG: hypothetical protein KJN96_04100 [Eudoraea sp.]|nr:hypothetical protein [Eudoraea sp.]MBT8222333.1 hypothetical protein [Eudoraea sp.]
MAKIKSIKLESIPEVIVVGDNVNTIDVVLEINFHRIDLENEMEYMLHLYLFDIRGRMDAPIFIPNWDECVVIPLLKKHDIKDYFLAKKSINLIAQQEIISIPVEIALEAEDIQRKAPITSSNLAAFATLVPAISVASKWSKSFEVQVTY